MRRPLSILQVSTFDVCGGAEQVAGNLFREYRTRGYRSQMAVGSKRDGDPHVFVVPNEAALGGWECFWLGVTARLTESGGRSAMQAARVTRIVSHPGKKRDRYLGVENFRFPGTKRILDLAGRPDLLHCHNLHGEYFDLRALEWLSAMMPVVITMHDAWLLSGHCVHSLECQRWRTGCGSCPDLTLYPAIERDATAYNWERKRQIYRASKLYVATPCRWLMEKVEQSILAPATVGTRVIPYGIDLDQFKPTGRAAARAALGIPANVDVILLVANGVRRNPWKDYATVRSAVEMVAAGTNGRNVLFIALGDEGPTERVGRAELRFEPFQKDPSAVARFYNAADLYVHGARADTFPNVVLEALACGTPVVGTAVGGIPEQIRGVGTLAAIHELNSHDPERSTGLLVPLGNAEAMAHGISTLLANPALRSMLSANAVLDARRRFDLQRQVDDYLQWYEEIMDERRGLGIGTSSPAEIATSEALV